MVISELKREKLLQSREFSSIGEKKNHIDNNFRKPLHSKMQLSWPCPTDRFAYRQYDFYRKQRTIRK